MGHYGCKSVPWDGDEAFDRSIAAVEKCGRGGGGTQVYSAFFIFSLCLSHLIDASPLCPLVQFSNHKSGAVKCRPPPPLPPPFFFSGAQQWNIKRQVEI